MARVHVDLTGKKFGRLLAVCRDPSRKDPHYICVCECGKSSSVLGRNLTKGGVRSCGCLRREATSRINVKHRMSTHPVYQAWSRIRGRCFNPNADDFCHYGGRGITVAPEWLEFERFRDDMLPTWKPGLSIERLDVNGNYEPGNCVWATQAEQTRNKRVTVYVDTPKGRMKLIEAAEISGINHMTLRSRVHAGWPAERLFDPVRR